MAIKNIFALSLLNLLFMVEFQGASDQKCVYVNGVCKECVRCGAGKEPRHTCGKNFTKEEYDKIGEGCKFCNETYYKELSQWEKTADKCDPCPTCNGFKVNVRCSEKKATVCSTTECVQDHYKYSAEECYPCCQCISNDDRREESCKNSPAKKFCRADDSGRCKPVPSTKTPEETRTTSAFPSTKRTSTSISTSTTQRAETSTKKPSSTKFRTKNTYLWTVKTFRTTKELSEETPFTTQQVKTIHKHSLIQQSTRRLITKLSSTKPQSKKSETSNSHTTVDPTVNTEHTKKGKVSNGPDVSLVVLIVVSVIFVLFFIIVCGCCCCCPEMLQNLVNRCLCCPRKDQNAEDPNANDAEDPNANGVVQPQPAGNDIQMSLLDLKENDTDDINDNENEQQHLLRKQPEKEAQSQGRSQRGSPHIAGIPRSAQSQMKKSSSPEESSLVKSGVPETYKGKDESCDSSQELLENKARGSKNNELNGDEFRKSEDVVELPNGKDLKSEESCDKGVFENTKSYRDESCKSKDSCGENCPNCKTLLKDFPDIATVFDELASFLPNQRKKCERIFRKIASNNKPGLQVDSTDDLWKMLVSQVPNLDVRDFLDTLKELGLELACDEMYQRFHGSH